MKISRTITLIFIFLTSAIIAKSQEYNFSADSAQQGYLNISQESQESWEINKYLDFLDNSSKDDDTYIDNGNHNFKVIDNHIIWQRIYVDRPKEDVSLFFNGSGFKISSMSDSLIVGETVSRELPFQKFGYRRGFVRMYYLDPCTIYFNVNIKDSRYRVTISLVIWDNSVYFGGATLTGKSDMDKILLKNDGTLRSYADKDFIMFDQMFIEMFDAPKIEKDEDW